MFEKVQSLPLKSSVSAFNYAFVYHYDKPNDLHTIGCLDVDLVNLTRYKLTAAKTVEQVNCVQVKIDPIDEATQFCLIEFHSFKFLGLDLFCLISSNGLHVSSLSTAFWVISTSLCSRIRKARIDSELGSS